MADKLTSQSAVRFNHIGKTSHNQTCDVALTRNNLLGVLVKQLKLLCQVTSQFKSGLCIVLWPVLMPVVFDARCSLGPLVNKVKEFQVETIVDTLCCNMVSDKEQLRDISSIGEGLLLISCVHGGNECMGGVCVCAFNLQIRWVCVPRYFLLLFLVYFQILN